LFVRMCKTMISDTSKKKTILLAFGASSDAGALCDAFPPERYRIIRADNILSLISHLERYVVDLLIVETELAGISMEVFLPYIRERYNRLKVIVAMKEYSAKLERSMRPHKVLYVLTWPLNSGLLRAIVERGLAYEGEAAKTA
jgi:DNA-binding NtrC family response regulator